MELIWSQQPIQRNEGEMVQMGIRGEQDVAMLSTEHLYCLVKKEFRSFIWRWNLDQLVKEVGSLQMAKKGRFSTQFLEVFNLRWFGTVLSLDKKETIVEMEKTTFRKVPRMFECEHTLSTNHTPSPAAFSV